MQSFEQLLIRPAAVKAESERVLRGLGARICDWLPSMDHTEPRPAEAIAQRIFVLNALVQLPFQAPPPVIRRWIVENGLQTALAGSEKFILDEQPQISEQSMIDLSWKIEALWAFMWVCNRIETLNLGLPCGDELASMLPDLRRNEPATRYYDRFRRRRSYKELYAMRDLIYRAHWYARDGQLQGYGTDPINLEVVMERRRAIAWVTDRTADWDDTDQST